MRRRGPETRYFGTELEADAFGVFKKSKAFLEAHRTMVAQYADRARLRGWMPYEAAESLVRNYYDGDPANPEKEFANDLRLEIAEVLGLSERELEHLVFYTAVGTPIDTFHGVDGWVEYQDPKTKRRVKITLDVTKNTAKDEYKADVIVPEAPSPEEDGYIAFVEQTARGIATQMKERMETWRLPQDRQTNLPRQRSTAAEPSQPSENRRRGRRRLVRTLPKKES